MDTYTYLLKIYHLLIVTNIRERESSQNNEDPLSGFNAFTNETYVVQPLHVYEKADLTAASG